MNNHIILFIFLFSMTLQNPTQPSSISATSYKIEKEQLWLPMNKKSEYGKDICHSKEIDEKLDYEIH